MLFLTSEIILAHFRALSFNPVVRSIHYKVKFLLFASKQNFKMENVKILCVPTYKIIQEYWSSTIYMKILLGYGIQEMVERRVVDKARGDRERVALWEDTLVRATLPPWNVVCTIKVKQQSYFCAYIINCECSRPIEKKVRKCNVESKAALTKYKQ